MAARRARRHLIGDDGGLDLTPLLDVIFNLVFFFIVATTIRTDQSFLDLSLAEASEAEQRRTEETIPVISVSKDGEYSLDGRVLTADELEAELRRLAVSKPETPLVLRPDSDASWQMTVNAMNIAVKAGLRNINAQVEQDASPVLRNTP